jgi:thiamine biosynthesis lipoprotein
MGTFYTIKVVMESEKGGHGEKFHRGIKDILQEVNQQMSVFDPQSEVSRFNRYQKLDWFPVSKPTVAVLTEAQTISKKSGGAFDVTVAPLIEAWGFGAARNRNQVPSGELIASLRERIGYQKLAVRLDPAALKKEVATLSVNLSAIAKGYGVDKVAVYLRGVGFRHFLVEIGGELRARGQNLQGSPWRIGVATPQTELGIQTVVPLSNRAMATSGDYRNYFKVEGKRFSHTIDPRTGRPVNHTLASVTVVHKFCTLADAWATALHVLGPEEGYRLAEKEALPVLFIIRSDSGFSERRTPALEKLVTQDKR